MDEPDTMWTKGVWMADMWRWILPGAWSSNSISSLPRDPRASGLPLRDPGPR